MKGKKPYGFDLLREQTLTSVLSFTSEVINEWAEGDSEIERLFFAALTLRVEFGFTEFTGVLKAADPDHASQLKAIDRSRDGLILERQVQIGSYRVDFVVNTWTFGYVWGGDGAGRRSSPHWRRLVVECDGHDFHERTKEQASRDKARDRFLVSEGFDVFRFTGSELWRDPWGCADQVCDWALRGFG